MNDKIPSDLPEPSVLDLVKSKLRFWKRGEAPVLALETPSETKEKAEAKTVPARQLPWRTLMALALALAGQRMFEPLTRAAWLGTALYLTAGAALMWAYLRKEWVLVEAPRSQAGTEPMTFRRLPMILSLVLALLAFLFMGNNRFTAWNLMLWCGAIACFIQAMWLKGAGSEPFWKKTWGWFTRREWTFRITPWTVLVAAVSAIIIFFRVYQIQQIPAEPFSDHAEKILDIFDITQGETAIYFERNTGREAFQMYLTLLVSWIFGTGLSFLSLKIGTVICGLATLPFVYVLGKEIGGRRVALLALFITGIAYWPNVISRVGLRFPLYPLFVAPTLLYLIRGLRRESRNDFILAGVFLGLGLHGYSPFRIMPVVILAGVGLYLLHTASKGKRAQVLVWLSTLIIASVLVFLPLFRYAVENPAAFSYRTMTRLEPNDQTMEEPVWQVLLLNLWNAVRMFNWDDGEIWVHSVTHRPALDVVSAALFLIGTVLLLVRYIFRRDWLDMFLLISIPLLQLPSSLSIAFPAENPALNRAGGALIPVFLVVALAMDSLMQALRSGKGRRVLPWIVTGVLFIWMLFQNYDLVFHQYDEQFRMTSWNSSEMGAVIKQFEQTYGTTETIWIVPYPYWVDTRLPGIWAGIPNRDFAMWRADLPTTLSHSSPKLFIVKADEDNPQSSDDTTLQVLEQLYPNGSAGYYSSVVPFHDFWIFFVP